MSCSTNGMTGALATNLPVSMILSAFSGIAWYNCVDLNVRIWMVFKHYQGLYFWSLLISSWGTFFTPIPALMKFYEVWSKYLSVALIVVSWWCMVTGQALVLYSRLHLILHDERKLRYVLIMIIFNAIVFHAPTTILAFGACLSHRFRME
jgi:hypothetical protein